MHDIDAQISRISGQQNYMESLQKITGNIMTIDTAIFKEKHSKICACEFNIKLLLKRLSETNDSNTVSDIRTSFDSECERLNIKNNTFVLKQHKNKQKPPREIINDSLKPNELVKTQWFKQVKTIEKDINKVLSKVFPQDYTDEQRTFEYIDNDNKKHPELVDIRTIYDCKLDTEINYRSFMQMSKCCRIIINILLMPMYDVRSTIERHWPKIDQIFKSRAFQTTGIISPNDIINMLTQFIIAKYRATITGNNKHYVKLFLNTIGDDNISKMDGARFMEIMDSIDLDKLNKNDKVYKFAMGAKTTMKKIVGNEHVNVEDVIHELDSMFKDDTEVVNENNVVNDDKFSDLL